MSVPMPVKRRFADAETNGDVPQTASGLKDLVDILDLGVGANGAWPSHVLEIIARRLEISCAGVHLVATRSSRKNAIALPGSGTRYVTCVPIMRLPNGPDVSICYAPPSSVSIFLPYLGVDLENSADARIILVLLK